MNLRLHLIRTWILVFALSLCTILHSNAVGQAANQLSSPLHGSIPNSSLDKRKELFDHVSFLTQIPWPLLAAIDQYERTLSTKTPQQSNDRLIAINILPAQWSGALNPNQADSDPMTIAFFGGIGKDGSGDGLASRTDDLDILATLVNMLQQQGTTEEDYLISLWTYYQNSRSIERIQQFAKIYDTYQTLDLNAHAFPFPLHSDYAYRSTWGAKRGWGGKRIHEGIDLFARHGVPVQSTSYGVVEELGWNLYGGWRVGIRDVDNLYHYYAHLSGFAKQLKIGDVVKPGKTIGWVGNSGYGKPGTSGKFPPHLHYGIYRDHGHQDWAFDPFPLLKKWERQTPQAQGQTKQSPPNKR